jgi:hypothetical protein
MTPVEARFCAASRANQLQGASPAQKRTKVENPKAHFHRAFSRAKCLQLSGNPDKYRIGAGSGNRTRMAIPGMEWNKHIL